MLDRQGANWCEQTPTVQEVTLVSGPVETAIIWQEAEQISLAQLAHCLAEGRPEIVEAAVRLHTRTDVQWTHPPAVCTTEA